MRAVRIDLEDSARAQLHGHLRAWLCWGLTQHLLAEMRAGRIDERLREYQREVVRAVVSWQNDCSETVPEHFPADIRPTVPELGLRFPLDAKNRTVQGFDGGREWTGEARPDLDEQAPGLSKIRQVAHERKGGDYRIGDEFHVPQTGRPECRLPKYREAPEKRPNNDGETEIHVRVGDEAFAWMTREQYVAGDGLEDEKHYAREFCKDFREVKGETHDHECDACGIPPQRYESI